MAELTNYRYGGARALVMLHEEHMPKFLETWKVARAAGVTLPETDDPNYASMEALLKHVLLCARHYMVWMCEMMELPDPGIRPAPDVDAVEAEAADYLQHVLERWRLPLSDLPEERFHHPTFRSRWNVDYCIDAMLEHAVMHPIRHRFQLEALNSG